MPIAPPRPGQARIGFRWVILALICAGTTINYIDRLVIAILAPDLQKLYHITDAQYGYIGSAFSIAYALGQLGCGWLLDGIGTRIGYALAVAAWSISAMLTALGRGALSFSLLRATLGVCESPGYPAAAKVCAEWFPRRQRAFAFGFVNAGCNMAAIIAALLVPWLSLTFGWQWAFIGTGALGLLLLAGWIPLYKSPQEHPLVSVTELALIQSDPPETTIRLTWRQTLRYRQSWVFVAGKFLTDAMWWFYITWVPKFLSSPPYNLGLVKIGLPLIAIYLMADLGSIGGGWLSSALIHRGISVNRARKTAMLLAALLALPMMILPSVTSLWTAVLILGLATAGHQGYSSNNYTICSDLFPKSMIGAIAGLGGTFGYIGASLFQAFTGNWVQYTHNYYGPFICASVAYLISVAAIHLVSPRLTPVTIVEQGT
jgi:ACS family hexuronate transporter-like MFS transporter